MNWMKLFLAINALGVVALWITERNVELEGLGAAAWMGGAFIGFMLSCSALHSHFHVGCNDTLQRVWGLSLGFWILAMTYVIFVAESPGLLSDLHLIGAGLFRRIGGLFG